MKILHFISENQTGSFPLGTPGRFTDLLEALRKDGHDNTILIPEIPVLQAALERKEIPFISMNVSFLNNIFRTGFHKKLLKRTQPDVILVYNEAAHDDNDFLSIEDNFDGPIRNVRDFYIPVVAPDPSTKKMDREETHTPPENCVIGCFAPEKTGINNLEILFKATEGLEKITYWFAIEPALSQSAQKIVSEYGLENQCRFFDVTVPRGAFYKGADIIFVPQGGIDSDMAFVEALALGRPVISCSPHHKNYASDQTLNIFTSRDQNKIRQEIEKLSKDEAYRTKMGEQGRQVYEERLTPDNGLKKLLSHL